MDIIKRNYQALLAVAIELNSQRDTKSLWQTITKQMTKVIPWARASVTLYEPQSDGFKFFVVTTTMAKVVLERDTVVPREGSGMGWAYEHQTMHIRPHLRKAQVFLEDQWYVEEGLGRMINVPLLIQKTCIGVLNIGSVDSGELDPVDQEFLTQVAMQMAYAIDHVQTYEQIDRLRKQLTKENRYLTEELRFTKNLGKFVGNSQIFQQVLGLAKDVAPTPTTVLITGETGTGKELLAQAIHDWSPRQQKPMVRVNCAAFPAGLVESELFGHEKGAFTGADHRREGRFELAHGGTLFLDEIGEMPLETQAKLLRVLQDGMVDRLGGKQPIPVDVRVIAATNADLPKAVKEGKFRSDLFYRLNVFPIGIPPLRNRPEDIPLLAEYFLEQYRSKLNRSFDEIEPDSLNRLIRYSWPGNVRELENVIERAMIVSKGHRLRIEQRFLTPEESDSLPSAQTTLHDVERHHIASTLASTNWQIEGPDGAAQQLGIAPSTLRSRIRKLALQRPTRS